MNSSRRGAFLATRIAAVSIGCLAIWWAVSVLPTFRHESAIEDIARRIIAEDEYKTETLTSQLPAIEEAEGASFCRPAGRRSAAIIRLRLAEDAVRKGDGPLERVDEARNSIRTSLACSPADAFLWLALFWLETTKDGPQPEHLEHLRMSYRLGPHEGWIALKRNPLAFAIFDKLPGDISLSAIHEFADILESGFHDQAVAILTGAAWPQHDLLLANLSNVGYPHRLALARALQARDLNLTIPGIRPLDLGLSEHR